jgi:hypothetical protein
MPAKGNTGARNMEVGTSFGGDVRQAYDNQIDYCEKNDATITVRIVTAIRDLLSKPDAGPFIAQIRDWAGVPLADGLPLRSAGALHGLYLSGAAPELAPIYAGQTADDLTLMLGVVRKHAQVLLPWLAGPPQTNEAGRSSGFAAAMLWLVEQGLPPRIEPLEIGSSAGINLMMDRFRWNLGGVMVSAADPIMSFTPEWRGPPPPARSFTPAVPEGCDVAPLDLTDPEQALRLKAFIWPEHTERFARLEAAIAAAKEQPPRLVKMHAADFVRERLTRPQAEGTTRVLMHSIVWQYLPEEEKQQVTEVMEAAGAAATPERALAWIALEADRTAMGHALQVRYWPGRGEQTRLGAAHAHGAWLEWLNGGSPK